MNTYNFPYYIFPSDNLKFFAFIFSLRSINVCFFLAGNHFFSIQQEKFISLFFTGVATLQTITPPPYIIRHMQGRLLRLDRWKFTLKAVLKSK
jgi:hypothetical protein